MTTRVVILNGVGSAGKSSIARELQQIATLPMLHVSMDAFLEMLPSRTFGTPEGIRFEQRTVEGRAIVQIHSGPTSERALTGMRLAVAAMATAGNHLIVDEVATGREIQEYRELLVGCDVTLVKVDASLDALERRERERGDRLIGLARGQFGALHEGIEYDVVVDAEHRSPADCAQLLRDSLDL